MKTAGINELRALVAEALNKDDAEKLAEAIIRATELAEEDARPVTREYLDARLAELRADLRGEFADKLRDQTRWLTGTFVVLIMAAVILQHFWR